MPDICVRPTAFQVRQGRVLSHLDVVGSYDNRGEVRRIVDRLGPGVGRLHQESMRETLRELNEAAVINRIGSTVEDLNPTEGCYRPGIRISEEAHGFSGVHARRHGFQRRQVDIARTAQVRAANSEISERDGIVTTELLIDIKTPLVCQRLDIIRSENKD